MFGDVDLELRPRGSAHVVLEAYDEHCHGGYFDYVIDLEWEFPEHDEREEVVRPSRDGPPIHEL